MTLTATITDILPETVYQDTVYDQRPVIETSNEVQIGLFDPDLLASSNMIGDTVELTVVAYIVKDAKKLDNETKEIIPNEAKPRDWQYHTYIGEVVEMPASGSSKYLLLDVGDGVVSVDTDVIEVIEEPVSKGDYLRVRVSRSDLHGVNRLSS